MICNLKYVSLLTSLYIYSSYHDTKVFLYNCIFKYTDTDKDKLRFVYKLQMQFSK